MPQLLVRILSAFVAVFLLALSYYFGKLEGLALFGLLLCSIGTWEYSELTLSRLNGRAARNIFRVLAPIGLILLVLLPRGNTAIFSSIVALNLSLMLWFYRGKQEVSQIFQAGLKTGLGYIYTVLFPSFALAILFVPNGHWWFLLLLVVTFAGDIFAYFGGLTFGKHRLMPALSPKKSIEGALFGFVGSVISALVFCHFLIPELSYIIVFVWSVVTSFLCQTGDLFESLLKREAKVKDSGKIMPGHGGVLDRLDGVYFGAPALYLLYVLTL
ncbi:MAG: phosphatidate cytidylyltransferase [Bdellovibrionales bacterium]|nr:phosphatidate cytidylyltransferase [Bdellovibrionales bacterium]